MSRIKIKKKREAPANRTGASTTIKNETKAKSVMNYIRSAWQYPPS